MRCFVAVCWVLFAFLPPGLMAQRSSLARRLVRVDRAWLAQRGRGPYLLSQPATTYRLLTDVATEGTAFVVGAEGVDLDLNGHRVVYGESARVRVVNGGFEEGSATRVPGWDLGGAPAARLAPNTSHLYGRQVLRLASLTRAQSILSDPVSIPSGSHTYVATVTPGGQADWRTQLRLSVLDADTGKELATAKSANVERGFSAVARFFPGTPRRVRLQIVVTPPPGKPVTVDLDDADLFVADDYGVLATTTWGGEIPGFPNLPASARAVYRKAARVTIRNGRIEQGKGHGYGSPPIYARQINGLLVDGVQTRATGMDTVSLDATQARGGVIIRDSVFREEIDNISNRMRDYATLSLASIKGRLLVERNQILGSPQLGIALGNNDGQGTVVVRQNEIRQRAVVANAYGIALAALRNFDIDGNKIIPASGRGIIIDGYSRQPVADGKVRNNYVEVREAKNREYATRLEARALRMRNDVDARGPQRRLLVTNNTFIARTEEGWAEGAFAGRLTYVNRDHQMDDAGIVIEGNLFKAIVNTASPAYRAHALVLDGIDPGINLHIQHNVLESNDVSLALTQADGGAVRDVQLLLNTLRKSSEGPPRPYIGILAGYWTREIEDVRLIDTRLENGATMDVTWAGTGSKSLALGRSLAVEVRDAQGGPREGVTVLALDETGREVFKGLTDSNGRVPRFPVVTAFYHQPANSRRPPLVEHPSPIRLMAQLGGEKRTRTVEPDNTPTVTITLR